MDEKTIFLQALDIDSDEQRRAFLEQACGGDPGLRANVDRLLRAYDSNDDLLETPPPGLEPIANTADTAPSSTRSVSAAGTVRVPGYEILGELGRGGMAVVYKARQIQAERIVALKMILADEHAAQGQLDRFRTEAEAIARLQHPGIVQIFEVGEHRGRPFFSLELCAAGNLAHYLSGTPLPPNEAAQLLLDLARAVHVAHEAQVIHRDLKPANILLTPRSGTETGDVRPPLSSLVAKVTDFGLAKKLDDVSQTHTGVVMGTPSYMGPEQAQGKKNVDAAADVYSLGAILYECLTGRPPFQAATSVDTILQVIRKEPVAPRQLQPSVPRDLETICLKCLHKEPHKRYASAQELADDMERFLQGKPITARPVGRIERGWRWCRRNPVVASLLAAVIVVLVTGIAGTSWGYVGAVKSAETALLKKREADKQKNRAVRSEAETKKLLGQLQKKSHALQVALARKDRSLFASQLMRVKAIYKADPDSAFRLLHDYEKCPLALRCSAWHFYHNICKPKPRTQDEWTSVPLPFKRGPAALSPDGKIIAAGRETTLYLLDASTGNALATLGKHDTNVDWLLFSTDGKTLASTNVHKPTKPRQRPNRTIHIWDVTTKQRKATLDGDFTRLRCFALHPHSSTLATGHDDGFLHLWDTATGKARSKIRAHRGFFIGLGFSPDGKSLISADTVIKVREPSSGKLQATLQRSLGDVQSLALSPDGKTMVTGSLVDVNVPGAARRTLKLWDMATRQERFTLKGHRGHILCVAFSPDGNLVASGGSDGTIKLWDRSTGQEKATLHGHQGPVLSLRYTSGGTILQSLGSDRTVKSWDFRPDRTIAILEAAVGRVIATAFTADGKYLRIKSNFAFEEGGEATLFLYWDLSTCQPLATPPNLPFLADSRISPDGRLEVRPGQIGEHIQLLRTGKQVP